MAPLALIWQGSYTAGFLYSSSMEQGDRLADGSRQTYALACRALRYGEGILDVLSV
jgi:hypothetical protein